MRFTLFLLLITPGLLQAQEQHGSISGQVIDLHSQRPLPGVNIVLMDHERGSISDDNGRFTLDDLASGSYRLQVSMIGYETAIRPDLIVRPQRITRVKISLGESALGMENTTVSADYFSAVEEASVSAVNFSYEEIRRSPGSAQDISRLLQAMPSVNMNNDQRNDLIVRGGSPTENLTLVDGFEIPNINHFPTQGASGGPIGLLNVDLIEDANFYAGGFSSRYGDRLSSVLSIDLREGNRSEFDGEINMGMAGAGFIFEGPLGQGKGAWIASARRSYLDLIVDAIGTGAVPLYSDVQGKLSYDLGTKHKLSMLGIGGFDQIEIAPGDQDENDDRVINDANQYVLGMGWKWLWSQRGFSHTTLAYSQSDFAIDVEEDLSQRLLYRNDSRERGLALRSRAYYSPSKGRALSAGIEAKRFFSDFAIFAAADTNRLNQPLSELRINQDLGSNKIGLFFDWEEQLNSRFKAKAGLRYDYFAYNEKHNISPRAALSWNFDERTSLNMAFGLYYQNLPPLLLVQHADNRRLPNPRATHWILGLKRQLTPSLLLSAEVYAKDYDDLPYDPDDPYVSIVDAFADFGSPTPGRLVGGGQAQARGIELLLQKKLAQDLYGTLSYAYARSRYTDLTGVERNRNFDNRHLFSLIAGYRPNERYEFSARWSYAGGRPFTPFDEELSRQLGFGVVQANRVNRERLDAYHRLDLRFDHRQHFDHFNIVSFFTLLNTYNRANIFTYYWDESEGKTGRIEQWSFLPVGGFELEF